MKGWYAIHYLLNQKEPDLNKIKNAKFIKDDLSLKIALKNNNISFEIIQFLIENGSILKNDYLFLTIKNEGKDRNKIISLLLDYGLTLSENEKKIIKKETLYIDPIEKEYIDCIKQKTKLKNKEITLFVKLYFIDERLINQLFTSSA